MEIMLFKFYFASLLASSIAQKQNVLLLIIDDLRTTLGCYGDTKAHTPNIDRLSDEAALFSQAFAQQALCAPSRNSFLTSRRPDTLQLYDFYSYWRKTVGNFTTLPQYFKTSGYITKSVGKVFHPGVSSNYSDDSPYSWTEEPFHPYTNKYKNAAVCRTNSRMLPAQNLVCPIDVSSMPNKTLPDIEILQEAKHFLSNHAKDTQPFFLAVGFQKPHIPLKYPEEYLKYHPLHKFNVPNPYKWPKEISSIAYNPWIDLRRREDIKSLNLKFPWDKIPATFGKLIIQSYYAAVSYVDDLIGMLINHLKRLSLQQNTVIILMSDHGWSLGEHATWSKYSNFDVALRVPLIISIPGLTFHKQETRVNFKYVKTFQTNLMKRSANGVPKTLPGSVQNNKHRGQRDIITSFKTLQGNDYKINTSNTVRYSKPAANTRNEEQTCNQVSYFLHFPKGESVKNTQDEQASKHEAMKHMRKKYSASEKTKSNLLVLNTSKVRRKVIKKQKTGVKIDAIVELVDIFPTIADLAGIPIPVCSDKWITGERRHWYNDILDAQIACSEGITLLPLVKAAFKNKPMEWKKAAFGQYPRPGVRPTMHPNSDEPRLKEIKAMGYTLRTERYRYTAWLQFQPETKTSNWSSIIAEELYDHKLDKGENQNVENVKNYFIVKENLKTLLQRGWRSALPENFNL